MKTAKQFAREAFSIFLQSVDTGWYYPDEKHGTMNELIELFQAALDQPKKCPFCGSKKLSRGELYELITQHYLSVSELPYKDLIAAIVAKQLGALIASLTQMELVYARATYAEEEETTNEG